MGVSDLLEGEEAGRGRAYAWARRMRPRSMRVRGRSVAIAENEEVARVISCERMVEYLDLMAEVVELVRLPYCTSLQP